MNLEKYSFRINPENTHYEFYSEGPKGKIKKVILYTLMPVEAAHVFNLGFGDWDEEKHSIDDLITTDNKDREKVLATVAATIAHFINLHPDAVIFIQGSTASRTRLYRMAISTYYDEITADFIINGFNVDEWETFAKDKNYQAFLVAAK